MQISERSPLVLSVFIMLCASAFSQSDAKWEHERAATASENKTISAALKVIAATHSNVGNGNVLCIPKGDKDKTRFQKSTDAPTSATPGRVHMKSTKDAKKYEVSPRPKPDNGPSTPSSDDKKNGPSSGSGPVGPNACAPSNPTPAPGGPTGGRPGLGGFNKPGTTWTDLFNCLNETKFIVADNTNDSSKVQGEATPGKMEIRISASTLMKAQAAAAKIMDPDNSQVANPTPEQVEALLSLCALLMHEIVHTKQDADATRPLPIPTPTPGGSTGGGTSKPPGEYTAYNVQWRTLCWVRDGLTSNPNPILNNDQKDVFKVIAKGLGYSGDLENIPAIVVFLNGVGAMTPFANQKEFALKQTLYAQGPSGGGPDGLFVKFQGGYLKGSAPIGGSAVVAAVKFGGGPEIQVPITGMATTAFAIPATQISGTTAIESALVAGFDGAGQSCFAMLIDGDGDGLPDSAGPIVAVGTTFDFVESYLYSLSANGVEAVFLLKPTLGRVDVFRDTDTDGVPDVVSVYSTSPSFISAVALRGFWVESGVSTLIAQFPDPPTTSAIPQQTFVAVKDTNTDWIADNVSIGTIQDLFQLPATPPRLQIGDLQSPEQPSIGLMSGSTGIYAGGSGIAADNITLYRVDNAITVLGTATITAPENWALVALPSPIQGTAFMMVESTVTGLQSEWILPRFGLDPDMYSATPVWDLDNDGNLDTVIRCAPDRMIVAQRLVDGTVVGQQEIVLPSNLAGSPDFSDPGAIRFNWVYSGTPSDSQNTFIRTPMGSPVLLAQPMGDLDGDGNANDILSIVRTASGAYRIWYQLSPATSWSQYQLPTSLGEIATFECSDFDGDGRRDVLVSEDMSHALPKRHLFRWDTNGFAAVPFPLLIQRGSRFIVGQALNVAYDLELEGGNPGGQYSYVMGLSQSGTDPGTDFQGVHFPLNVDDLLNLTLSMGNSQYTVDFQGTFDAEGRGSAHLCYPAGISNHWVVWGAYGVIDTANATVTAASNAVQFTID